MIFRYAYWSMPLIFRAKCNYSIQEFKERYLAGLLSKDVETWFEEFKLRWAD